MVPRRGHPQPTPPDLPAEKAYAALSAQLQLLQNLRGRKYDEAKPAEEEWEQLTEKIIIRAFGSDSPNANNFHRARWAGEHQITPYGAGIPHARFQSNYEARIQAYETVLKSCLSELKLDLPEGQDKKAGDSVARQPTKVEVNVAGSFRAFNQDAREQHEARKWDAFICHASEDKKSFVHPLAELLTRRGLRVWYDKFTLKVGDSLRQAIDDGLTQSRFGIVVLSPSFFEKKWPKWELDGLVAKEVNGKKVILPVWHDVSFKDVNNYSPMLAGRYAANSKDGLEIVADQLIDAIKAEGHEEPPPIE